MKRRFFALAILAAGMAATASATPAPAKANDTEGLDSAGFVFKDIILVPTTPVKDQNKSGTCWCFAGISTLEEDVLRKGGPELDLSEMYLVRQNYIDKAKKYVRMGGKINFAQGGALGDVYASAAEYGVMPESAYSGLNYGESKHSHYEMADGLKGYLDAIIAGDRKLTGSWLKGFTAILDAYLGEVPEKFTYNGKTYTPKEFAKEIGLAPEEFVSLTSYTHHPFYTNVILEIPDNWRWLESYNVPIEKLKESVDNALKNGYTVGWAADVSEPTFKWKNGVAVLPAGKSMEDMSESEVNKWLHQSDKEREAAKNEVNGPAKERTITQETRQESFDNHETTDDHAMVIIGIAEDQEGNRFYKVKNSWDTNQIYDGYIYVSEPYFLEKTLSVTLNKNALPKGLMK